MALDIKYIYTYAVFLLFFVYIISVGAESFIPEDKRNRLEGLLDEIPENRPEAWWESIPVVGAIGGFLRGVFNGLSIFWALVNISSPIRWVTLLLFTPFGVTLFYIILTRLLRGSG